MQTRDGVLDSRDSTIHMMQLNEDRDRGTGDVLGSGGTIVHTRKAGSSAVLRRMSDGTSSLRLNRPILRMYMMTLPLACQQAKIQASRSL